jgi:hypothetical protein
MNSWAVSQTPSHSKLPTTLATHPHVCVELDGGGWPKDEVQGWLAR